MSSTKFYPTLFQHLATDTARNMAVSAGAGAGKTAVLTRRIIKILKEEKLTLNRMMVVTFTDKAAIEMKERVYTAIDKVIGHSRDEHFKKLRDDFLKNRISTFHAFCAGLLREYPIEANIDPYFRVMDETDKIFFLRRVIDRTINELASQKDHPDLVILNREWTKGAIINAVYAIIQRREDVGPWLREIQPMEWIDFYERLVVYQRNVLREICNKLSLQPEIIYDLLNKLDEALPDPPDDTSKLSLRRLELFNLLPELQSLFLTARSDDFDPAPVIDCVNRINEACNLIGSNAKAWKENPANLKRLRIAFNAIRNLIKAAQLADFEINQAVEEDGFQVCKALAHVAIACLNSYRDEKEKEHYLDFQDLQLKVLTLLHNERHKHILNELRENYLYIMVDEFQDTNSIQWDIVKLIASDEQGKLFGDRLFIVGDEKQAIYSFRGGDVSLFGKVRKELKSSNQERGTHTRPFSLLPTEDVEKDYQQEYQVNCQDDQFVKSGEVIFSDNFRSAAEPIQFFNLFFEQLMGQEYYEDFEARPQRLVCSGNRRKGSVELLLVDRDDNADDSLQIPSQIEDIDMHTKEAHLIASKIKDVLAGDNPLYDHVRQQAAARKPAIAILLNRRTKLKVYEEALRRENIDFIVVRGRGFFQRQEVVDLGNLLGFLDDPDNSIYLAGFLRSPVAHVSDEACYLLTRQTDSDSLWEKLCLLAKSTDHDSKKLFSDIDYRALIDAHKLLSRWLDVCRRLPLIDFIRFVLDEGGYFATLARGNRGEQALSNIEKLCDRAREATMNDQEDFSTFVAWLNERIDNVEDEGEADVDIVLGGSVQLMTVHQSKGLEFPMVFVPDLNASFNFGENETLRFDDVTTTLEIGQDGTMFRTATFEIGLDIPDPEHDYESTPTLIKKIIERRNREKIIAERKRLYYVAATRAMDHLVLVGQLKKRTERSLETEIATPINQLRNWMDWTSKILGLKIAIDGPMGTILLSNRSGDHLVIPYRLFDENQSILNFEEELRTEFPFE
ncbi:UvrD-helicase domain-containing protein [candidate division KSB1 bacterium]|nr:UvrD-helicase domain-containing protein [candidate division KSB1 bacterium]